VNSHSCSCDVGFAGDRCETGNRLDFFKLTLHHLNMNVINIDVIKMVVWSITFSVV